MASLVGAAGAYCEAFGIPLADLRVSGPGGEHVDDDDVCWPRDARRGRRRRREAPPDRPPPLPGRGGVGCESARRPPDAGPSPGSRGASARSSTSSALVGGGGGVFEATRSLRASAFEASPVFESSLREYVAYARAVARYDGACDVRKHASCPRCYLNGLPIFNVAPALRGDVDDRPAWLADDSETLMAAWDATVARAVGRPAAPDAADLADRSWSLTKVFVAPPGAITRLHYDNGHAHACVEINRWRTRGCPWSGPLFVCFDPKDAEHLHAIPGDDGVTRNNSDVDPSRTSTGSAL
ncbi:tRNA-Phe hydroxylase [Aureococcus anophagefferens]|nr:tRNA-Phe hydroxylase [Aureococcus anophagefferens]